MNLLRQLGLVLALAALPAMAAEPTKAEVSFFRAVVVDNHLTINELLREGLNPNISGTDRNEPAIVLALRHDSQRAFNALLNAPGIDLDARAPNGDTALMIAAYKGQEDNVRALLARGAQVNQPGWTALHYAAANGHRDLVFLLLEHNAFIDALSPNGTTPLMMAARDGHIDTVNFLLEEGADRNLRNGAGYTAYDMAVKFDKKDVMDRLDPRYQP